MFTTHATAALAVWSLGPRDALWFTAYVASVGAALLLAFLVATARTLRTFDPPAPAP